MRKGIMAVLIGVALVYGQTASAQIVSYEKDITIAKADKQSKQNNNDNDKDKSNKDVSKKTNKKHHKHHHKHKHQHYTSSHDAYHQRQVRRSAVRDTYYDEYQVPRSRKTRLEQDRYEMNEIGRDHR